jgi:hypothetical protein
MVWLRISLDGKLFATIPWKFPSDEAKSMIVGDLPYLFLLLYKSLFPWLEQASSGSNSFDSCGNTCAERKTSKGWSCKKPSLYP